MELNYREIIDFYIHNEKESLFSTQHNTKGQEYENILLVIGERNWPLYNYPEYLTDDIEALKDSIYERTHKLFYVSSSRAIKNLAVLYLAERKSEGLNRVRDWFGSDNVFSVSEFVGA